MSPEELARLREMANAMFKDGLDNQRVNAALHEASNGRVTSVSNLIQTINQQTEAGDFPRELWREAAREDTARQEAGEPTEETERQRAQRRRAGAFMNIGGVFPWAAGKASRVLPGGYQGEYGENVLRGRLEGERDVFREEHPWQSGLYETAGGATAGLLLGRAAGLMGSAVGAGAGATVPAAEAIAASSGPTARATRIAQQAFSTPIRRILLGGGVGGAAEAATQAAVEAEPGQRLEEAKSAAPWGAVFGTAAGSMIPPIARAGRKVLEGVTPGTMAGPRVDELVETAVEEAGGPEQLLPRAQELGPEASLAELDPALRQEVTRASTKPTARAALERDLRPGVDAMLEDTIDELRRITGHDMSTPSLRAVETAKLGETRRLYNQLENEVTDLQTNVELDALLERPRIANALDEIRQTAIDEGEQPLRELVTLVDGKWKRNPEVNADFRTLQWLKQELDDIVDTTPKPRERRRIANMRNAYREEVYKLVDGYPGAQEQWGSQMRVLEAIEDGAKFWRKSADEIAEDLAAMSPDAQNAYRASAVNSVVDQLAKKKRGADPDVVFDRPAVDAKMKELFDTQEQFDDFQRYLELKSEQRATYQAATGGSPTQPRTTLEAGLPSPTAGTAAEEARGRGLTGAIGRGIRGAYQARVPSSQFPTAVAERLGPRMTAKDQEQYLRGLLQPRGPTGMELFSPAVSAAAGAQLGERGSEAVQNLREDSPVSGLLELSGEVREAIRHLNEMRGGR